MNTEQIKHLIEQSNESACQHEKVTLRMSHIPFGFVKTDGTIFEINGISTQGAIYIAQKLEYRIFATAYADHWNKAMSVSYGDFVTFNEALDKQKSLLALVDYLDLQKAFNENNLGSLNGTLITFVNRKELLEAINDSERFVDYVNSALIQMIKYTRIESHTEYTAIVDHFGVLRGMPRYYDVYPSSEVLQSLVTKNIESRITGARFTPELSQIYMKSSTVFGRNDFAWGLLVENGETGHVRLAYRLYIAYRDQIYTRKGRAQKGKVRHESRLGEFVSDVEKMIDSLKDYEITLALETKPTADFSAIVLKDEYRDKLGDMIKTHIDQPVGKLVSALLDCEEHGKKTLAKKLAQELIDDILKQ